MSWQVPPTFRSPLYRGPPSKRSFENSSSYFAASHRLPSGTTAIGTCVARGLATGHGAGARGNDVFKVTSDQQSEVGVTLKLEGRLTAAWVEEFARALANATHVGAAVTLDLEGLSFADDRGVVVIRRAIERGVRCVGGSEFIGALIDGEQL
jgi:hypothetical protein